MDVAEFDWKIKGDKPTKHQSAQGETQEQKPDKQEHRRLAQTQSERTRRGHLGGNRQREVE